MKRSITVAVALISLFVASHLMAETKSPILNDLVTVILIKGTADDASTVSSVGPSGADKLNNNGQVPLGRYIYKPLLGLIEVYQQTYTAPQYSGSRFTSGSSGLVTGIADNGTFSGYSFNYTYNLSLLSSFSSSGSTTAPLLDFPVAISSNGDFVAGPCAVNSGMETVYKPCVLHDGNLITDTIEFNSSIGYVIGFPQLYGRVVDVNNNGQVVGYAYDERFMFYDGVDAAPRKIFWTTDSDITPQAINNKGLVVGEIISNSGSDNQSSEAFYLDSKAVTPVVTPINAEGSSVASGVNDLGIVVGASVVSGVSSGVVGNKYILQDHISRYLVSGSQWVITHAAAINNSNVIRASGYRMEGTSHYDAGIILLKPFPRSDRLRRMKITAKTNQAVDELIVWRPESGTWYVKLPLEDSAFATQWGLSGDIPLRGDFDGDQKSEYVVWRPVEGNWYVRYSDGTYKVVQWGLPGDVPVEGDFNGDGVNEYAVWRPGDGSWYIRFADDSYQVVQWGLPGDVPQPFDFNSDGKTDYAVWRPQNGTWYIKTQIGESSEFLTSNYQWGLPGDRPVAGDFDGDDKPDLAVWRNETGNWYVCTSRSAYNCYASGVVIQFGLPGDIPLVSDVDSDGLADLAVFRPSVGDWYVRSASGRSLSVYQQWGLSGDLPLMANIRDVIEGVY
ncbi:MAG: FG-GAP-like repeat-containing protein [bacterium]|nr:FG-GAP-like repeat-containing protein [bacterium]